MYGQQRGRVDAKPTQICVMTVGQGGMMAWTQR